MKFCAGREGAIEFVDLQESNAVTAPFNVEKRPKTCYIILNCILIGIKHILKSALTNDVNRRGVYMKV